MTQYIVGPVARGSEQISQKWVEGAKRECVKCGAKITNLAKQVGEVRSTYPGPKREIICMSCHMKPYYDKRK